MLTLDQLVTPVTEDEALATLLSILTQLGFQATAWQTGSVQLIMLRAFSRVWSKVTSTIADIAAGGFPSLAASKGLTGFLRLVAKYVYKLDYIPASSTVGTILLTSSAAAPLHTWFAGDVVVSDQPTGVAGANSYTVTVDGSLAPGSSASFEFKADVPGAAANIPAGTPLYLWTPLVGVTATNPSLPPPSNTWITTPGQDDEDNQRLAARCVGRWDRLTYSNTDGAYGAWLLEALPEVTRFQVGSAPGDANVTIYAATAVGGVTPAEITTAQDYINGIVDGRGRRPINDIVTVTSPSILTTPSLVVTAFADSGKVVAAKAAIAAVILQHVNVTPIGGYRITGSLGRVVYSELIAAAKDVDGVRKVSLNITDDIILLPGQIYVPALITVNVTAVSPGGP